MSILDLLEDLVKEARSKPARDAGVKYLPHAHLPTDRPANHRPSRFADPDALVQQVWNGPTTWGAREIHRPKLPMPSQGRPGYSGNGIYPRNSNIVPWTLGSNEIQFAPYAFSSTERP